MKGKNESILWTCANMMFSAKILYEKSWYTIIRILRSERGKMTFYLRKHALFSSSLNHCVKEKNYEFHKCRFCPEHVHGKSTAQILRTMDWQLYVNMLKVFSQRRKFSLKPWPDSANLTDTIQINHATENIYSVLHSFLLDLVDSWSRINDKSIKIIRN